MPVTFTTLAVLITIIAPTALATGVFFAALHWWVGKLLKSDAAAHGYLKLDVSEGCVVWAIDANLREFKCWPYFPLVCGGLTAFVATAIETVVFSFSSPVPFLWYSSGLIASVITPLGLLAAAGFLHDPLERLIGRLLTRRANDTFAYAAKPILEIRDVVREIDNSFTSMGLPAQTGFLEDCRAALLSRASRGRDAAWAELIRIKIRLEHHLRWAQYLAHLFESALIALKEARDCLDGTALPADAIETIHDQLYAQDLTDALNEWRWSDARQRLEKISSDLSRLSDAGYRAGATPKTVDDAYRILNVSDDTPTDKIKAVVKAYWQVWHPDMTDDDIGRFHRTVKLQQINAAWDVVQRARLCRAEAEEHA